MSLVVRSERMVLPDGVRPATILIRDGRIVSIGAVSDRPAGVPELDAGAACRAARRRRYARPHQRSRACRLGGLRARDSRGGSRRRHHARGHAIEQHSGDHDGCRPGAEARRGARPMPRGRGILGRRRSWQRRRPRRRWRGPACLASSASCARLASTSSGTSENQIFVRRLPILAALDLPLLAHAELPELLHDPMASRRPRHARSAALPHLARQPSRRKRAGRHRDARAARGRVPARASTSSISRRPRRCRRSVRPARPASRLSVETCPHYLTFAAEEIADGATAFKCAPPIRSRANRERLWAALVDGDIDLVATDHSPAPPALKHLDDGDFLSAWGGVASLQLGLSIVWTGAAAARCSAGARGGLARRPPGQAGGPVGERGDRRRTRCRSRRLGSGVRVDRRCQNAPVTGTRSRRTTVVACEAGC